MPEEDLTPEDSRALGRLRRDQERAIQKTLLQDPIVLEEILCLLRDALHEEIDPERVFSCFAEATDSRRAVLDGFSAGDYNDAVLDGIVFPRFLNASERLRERAGVNTAASDCLSQVEPLFAERERIIEDLTLGNASLVASLVASLEDAASRRSKAALEAAGMRGLSKASGRFEPERGYKFTTYAVWWVAECVGRELEMSCDEVMDRWSRAQQSP